MKPTVLVATDGTPAARGALWFANGLAAEKGWNVHAIGVVEPVPVFDAGFMVALPEMELYESRREALRDEIKGQIEEVTGDPTSWPVTVDSGIPGTKIVGFAEDIGAAAVLLGLGRHGPMDRVFGTETALQVLRVSHLPVIAVPEDLRELPRSAVLGVDFSQFSHRASDAAIELLSSPWEIHLVHVLSGMEFLPVLSEDWRGDYETELLDRLEEFSGDMRKRTEGAAHVHVLEGEPSHELLAFSQAKNIDMLVAGSHGHSFVGRLLMGSVSTRLVRASQKPVLVVPPGERSEEAMAESEADEPMESWARELNDFTKANAGRRTVLELHDPDIGKKECGRNFPLWGVDYDPKRDRINIMLGRSGTVEGHLTHSLSAPRGVRIDRDEEGRALSLHIDFRNGSAVLRIRRD
jgi:nucleotide-binding universal stress UspA family protein